VIRRLLSRWTRGPRARRRYLEAFRAHRGLTPHARGRGEAEASLKAANLELLKAEVGR